MPRAEAAAPGGPNHIAIILLNYKRTPDTLECLQSLARQTYRDFSVILLNYDPDNANSAPALRAAWPGLDLVEVTDNRGYAGNNNAGLRRALQGQAGWMLLLNEDTRIDPACLAELMAVAQSDDRIGMLGPLVLHRSAPDRIQSAGCRLSTDWMRSHMGQDALDEGQFVEPHDVDWLSGCALLVRRQVVETVGLFDEAYFMYFEETDWCLRAGRQGWRLQTVPRARLWHGGVWPQEKPRPAVTYFMARNRYRLFARNRAPARAWLAVIFANTRTLVSWSIRRRWRHLRPHRDALLHALADALRQRWGAGPY